jgi:hypothetical protein
MPVVGAPRPTAADRRLAPKPPQIDGGQFPGLNIELRSDCDEFRLPSLKNLERRTDQQFVGDFPNLERIDRLGKVGPERRRSARLISRILSPPLSKKEWGMGIEFTNIAAKTQAGSAREPVVKDVQIEEAVFESFIKTVAPFSGCVFRIPPKLHPFALDI